MIAQMVLWQEKHIKEIFARLVDAGALKPDVDIDFWAKTHASLNYAFMGRYAIGIWDTHEGHECKNLEGMIRALYNTVFRLHGK